MKMSSAYGTDLIPSRKTMLSMPNFRMRACVCVRLWPGCKGLEKGRTEAWKEKTNICKDNF